MDDPELMREILAALLADTSQQMGLLDAAIRAQNVTQCMRLAHYSKGACANVGANRAAGMFKQIESKAAGGEFFRVRRIAGFTGAGNGPPAQRKRRAIGPPCDTVRSPEQ